MREQASPHCDATSADLTGLDLPTVVARTEHLDGLLVLVVARTEHLDGLLVLVVADDARRLILTSGNATRPVDAIRGALRLAAGASAHARQLAAVLGRTVELETGDRHLPARPAWACVRCSRPWPCAAVPHLPARPAWVCVRRSRPWPCAAVRRRLSGEFEHDPAALAVLMTLRLAEASADLGVTELPDLYDQFLGWLPTPAVPSTHTEER
ncbi:hypothetical protein [Dactylosporangium sp. NPDC048998]|uniref:hypothetical protein n=1 Tax=Dactylosporangium sp. NPDC048998 TaxID=3363976 RepID=UPI00371C0411